MGVTASGSSIGVLFSPSSSRGFSAYWLWVDNTCTSIYDVGHVSNCNLKNAPENFSAKARI